MRKGWTAGCTICRWWTTRSATGSSAARHSPKLPARHYDRAHGAKRPERLARGDPPVRGLVADFNAVTELSGDRHQRPGTAGEALPQQAGPAFSTRRSWTRLDPPRPGRPDGYLDA